MLDPNHFRRLLSNPETTVEEDLESLELLLEEYPYLQSARALQLKIFKQNNSELYNDALKKTAAHTTDRNILFKFITSEIFKENKDIDETALAQEEDMLDTTSKNTHTPVAEITTEVVKQAENQEETSQILEIEAEAQNTSQQEDVTVETSNFEIATTQLEEQKTTKEEKEATPANILELSKPIAFGKQDAYSFAKWMQLTRQEPINREEEIQSDSQEDIKVSVEESLKLKIEKPTKSTDKVIHLVDEFLKNNPRPVRTQSFLDPEEIYDTPPQGQASQSLMTETLARVYLQQKNYTKAIQAYKILILKNPEKSGYFADKIRAIEKLTNKK